MAEHLKLWNTVEKTPLAHTKAITGKSYQGTSPKPHYLVHKATETFGPIGIGWGFTIENERIEEGAGGERMHIARVKVWYKWEGERGEVEHIGGTQFSGIRSSGKPFTDEDAPKKSVTDALVKALSMIGFAGDIFMGRFDDSKYVQELRDEARQETSSAPAPGRNAPAAVNRTSSAGATLSVTDRMVAAINERATAADIFKWWNLPAVQEGFNGLSDAGQKTVEAAKKRRLEEIEGPFAEAAE
jgi:hypothetical protein